MLRLQVAVRKLGDLLFHGFAGQVPRSGFLLVSNLMQRQPHACAKHLQECERHRALGHPQWQQFQKRVCFASVRNCQIQTQDVLLIHVYTYTYEGPPRVCMHQQTSEGLPQSGRLQKLTRTWKPSDATRTPDAHTMAFADQE